MPFSRLAALGAALPEVLVPKQGVDLAKWAVIACDQFTQDRSYWERVRAAVKDAPSALDCILPEAFLEDPGREGRIARIHAAMKSYLDGGLFSAHRGCVYLERDTPYRAGRRGLLVSLDLERYDWAAGARPLIRPTEGTVPERLPPRQELRRGAALELSHTLVLIDDEKDFLLPGLAARVKAAAPLYDTPLLPNSGHVRGWLFDSEADLEFLADGLEKLAAAAASRYGAGAEDGGEPFLYAVGDGNHSLAAAKGVWEEYKEAQGLSGPPEKLPGHPARYALVEIQNVYDPAIRIEPIHRFVYGAETGELEAMLEAALKEAGGLSLERKGGVLRVGEGGNDPSGGLALDYIQPLLDRFVREKPGLSIDYIHGEDEIFRLAGGPGGGAAGTGIILPPFDKQSLFSAAAKRGILPRKSFSMGEAAEKRFYLECRRLFG